MTGAGPGEGDHGDARLDDGEAPLPRRPVLAVLLVVAGAALVVLTAATVHDLASTGDAVVATSLIWSLLPAAVLAIGLRLAVQTFAGRLVDWPRVLLLSYVVAVLVIGLATVLGANTVAVVAPV